MKRTISWVVFALGAASFLFFSGCDEPNEPDLPREPYRLLAILSMATVPRDVDAQGNHVAVATDGSGTVVMDLTDVTHPDTLFVYNDIPHDVQCTTTRIDGLHHYLMVRTTSVTDWGQIPLFDYTKSTLDSAYVAQIAGNGYFSDYVVKAHEDSVYFWGGDVGGGDYTVTVFGLCRSGSGMPWSVCPQNGAVFTHSHAVLNGFDVSEGNVLAVALGQYGVHLHDGTTRQPIADFHTPGIAEDCAWRGSYLFVADRYHLTVVDASTPAEPRIVATLTIPSADRLTSVALSGDYACLMDDNDGIYVADISDPSNPKYAQRINLTEPAAIAVSGNRLYAIDESDGLLVYSR
jgi:hypothetical protein